jgi:REP element-mobilizing transposase RayT
MKPAKLGAKTSSARKRRRPVQLALALRTWGGKRKGAGRKPKGDKPGVPHRRRPTLAKRFPVHVTVRMLPHVWNLRSKRSFAIIGEAVRAAAERFGMRLCEFSVQGNHVHLVVEAADRTGLSRGMQGIGIRLGRRLNKLMGRKGTVLADRYHAHILRTPSEVRHAVHYLRHNYKKHALERAELMPVSFIDPFSSLSREHGITLPAPGTWLLNKALALLAAPS